eukprot:scaffold14378_cov19-Prasinocladus_malaysianus.AAC.1
MTTRQGIQTQTAADLVLDLRVAQGGPAELFSYVFEDVRHGAVRSLDLLVTGKHLPMRPQSVLCGQTQRLKLFDTNARQVWHCRAKPCSDCAYASTCYRSYAEYGSMYTASVSIHTAESILAVCIPTKNFHVHMQTIDTN